ncbi:hypothetical protein HK104_001135 [Borealophlyctis nickersoniae]|nr:hypothetical protein HK104_001135 [Borealophlyctis nickersoniae]
MQQAKQLGADGVVFGLLNPNGTVDTARTRELVELAKPMNVTFHRAFDMTRDPIQALEDIISVGGIQRILTSGQDSGALEGLPLLKRLVSLAGSRITIMPGGGVTPRNLDRILAAIDVPEVHMAIPVDVESKCEWRNPNVYMGVAISTPEYVVKSTDGAGVKRVVDLLKGVGK